MAESFLKKKTFKRNKNLYNFDDYEILINDIKCIIDEPFCKTNKYKSKIKHLVLNEQM